MGMIRPQIGTVSGLAAFSSVAFLRAGGLLTLTLLSSFGLPMYAVEVDDVQLGRDSVELLLGADPPPLILDYVLVIVRRPPTPRLAKPRVERIHTLRPVQ